MIGHLASVFLISGALLGIILDILEMFEMALSLKILSFETSTSSGLTGDLCKKEYATPSLLLLLPCPLVRADTGIKNLPRL